MNKKLLVALQKRNKARLEELRTKIEKGEVRAEDLDAMQEEVDQLKEELQEIADTLENMEDEGEEGSGDGEGEGTGSGEGEGRDGEPSEGDGEGEGTGSDEGEGEGQRSKPLSAEQRDGIVSSIAAGLSTKGHKSTAKKEKEIRSAFANFVIGRISEAEARSLGIEVGNGSVTIPQVIADEVITYAQEENLLRKYGTRVRTKTTQGYPILVKQAEANVTKGERSTDIAATDIEFDEISLAPAEFDALATVSKKLLKRSDVPVEEIVIEELKKAYVRKETNFMFNGDDVDNENEGSLAKKAVAFYEDTDDGLYDTLVKLKNSPATPVLKKARWIINRAALTLLETMKTSDGLPLLRPLTQVEEGIGYSLLGFPVDFTDNADGADPTKGVFYFGDFSQFRIQDVVGVMEIQRLVEEYSKQNKVGFQIYNIVDGQLIYSPFEPAVYRYEVGATAPIPPEEG